MAVLTTLEGAQLNFDPGKVSMLNVQTGASGETSTGVYGITKAMVRTAGTPQDFITRYAIAENFAVLTRPDGSLVWVAGGAVTSVRDPLPVDAPGTACVLNVGAMSQAVKEQKDVAIARLDAHGAHL
jgi:hypothetical protein